MAWVRRVLLVGVATVGRMKIDERGALGLRVEDVVARAEELVRLDDGGRGDTEGLHVLDDELRGEVLRAVAAGHSRSVELAAAVLVTDGIERWYA